MGIPHPMLSIFIVGQQHFAKKPNILNDKACGRDVHEGMPPKILATRAAFWPSGLRATRRSVTLAPPPYLRFVWRRRS
eukprot:1104159-Pleurochrysis_carterae.AAC.1